MKQETKTTEQVQGWGSRVGNRCADFTRHLVPASSVCSRRLLALVQALHRHHYSWTPKSKAKAVNSKPGVLKRGCPSPQTTPSDCVNLVENRLCNKPTLTDSEIRVTKELTLRFLFVTFNQRKYSLGKGEGLRRQALVEITTAPGVARPAQERNTALPHHHGDSHRLGSADQSTRHAKLL